MALDDKTHPHSHQREIGKLSRVAGQIEGVRRMIGEGRDCAELLAQLRAARSAIRSIEADILETHLKSCVTEAILNGSRKEGHRKIEELKDLFKRFDQE